MEKTTNNPLLPAGTGPERASISKVSEGPVPAGKKPPRQAIAPTPRSRSVRSAAAF
jgi:hypothetical protein